VREDEGGAKLQLFSEMLIKRFKKTASLGAKKDSQRLSYVLKRHRIEYLR